MQRSYSLLLHWPASDAAELHVVHAWTLFGESIMRTGGFTESEIRNASKTWLKSIVEQWMGYWRCTLIGAAIIHQKRRG